MDKFETFLLVMIIVLASVIANLSIDIASTYYHNRQYDVERIQQESEKEWLLSCARHRKELLRQGWLLDPRPELDELISHTNGGG